MKLNNSLCFCLLFFIYIVIGCYGIQNNSLTSDEPAYIGAAYSYYQGLGLNPEHPLFLKLTNSLLFWLQLIHIQKDIPALNNFINTFNSLDLNQIRLAAFNVGYQLLMFHLQQFDNLVLGSRLIYLGFNSLILIWLYFYSVLLKLINPKIALTFAVLWIFSPSFSSHSSLVTFDVAVAVSALMTVLSTAIDVYSVVHLRGQFLSWQFISLAFSLCFAINTKFSNLLLLPIVAIALLTTSLYLLKIKKVDLARQFIAGSGLSLGIQPILIWLMYRLAFRQMPGQSIGDIVQRYLTGIQMTIVTAKGEQIPFLHGQFRFVTYAQYLGKVIWFKENPVLFLLALFMLGIAGRWLWQRRNHLGYYWQSQGITVGGFALMIAAYPLIYGYLAQGSRCVIGYRYFYPILIFIYYLIAVLAITLRPYYPQKLLAILLALYIGFGLLAIPQTLSYVNPLWRSQKWLLANDSTLNWGQENRHAADYLLSQNLIPRVNKTDFIFSTFNAAININQYLEILSQKYNISLDIQSYYNQPYFQPLEDDINQLAYRYLLIDSSVLQILAVERHNQAIAANNWNFLQNHQPIYTRNDIIFLYSLR